MLRRVIRACADPILVRMAARMDWLRADTAEYRKINATISPSAKLYPSSSIHNLRGDPKKIVIAAHTHVGGQLMTYFDGGDIRIGEWSYIGDMSRIWSRASISIGSHVLISHLVDIHDTDSHPIDWQERRSDAHARLTDQMHLLSPKTSSIPVVIEDDAWVCFKATILKGVHVGRGAIIAAGAVVTGDVPPWTIVAGNPAKVVRALTEEEQRLSSAGQVR